MTGYIEYMGDKSTDFNVYVSGTGAHDAAEPDVTTYQIPGRSGDLAVYNNRYKNIEVTYPAFVARGFSANEQGIRSWLRRSNNYETLMDSYDPTHFRMARPTGELRFETVRPDAANFEIVFDCMPQRFLLSGEDEERPDGGGLIALDNPTIFWAKPFIWISDVEEGTEIEFSNIGTGKVWTLTATDDYTGPLVIDCERMDVYDDSTMENRNDIFDMPDGFPELPPGATNIQVTGTYTDLFVLPRWWEL